MARGNGRQVIVRDDVDRDRLLEHLGRAALRCGWRIYAFAIMPNHLHVVLKTPEPNLSRGMQAIERSELSRRGSRHPARAAWAYLARSRTATTNAELAVTLGLSRPECVPNLTRRFAAWLTSNAKTREQLRRLEERLN